MHSKAYRVFNKRTLIAEESVHVVCDETNSIVQENTLEEDAGFQEKDSNLEDAGFQEKDSNLQQFLKNFLESEELRNISP